MNKTNYALVFMGLAVLIAFIYRLTHCGPDRPDKKTISEYFGQHPNAEKIDLADLDHMRAVMADFKKYAAGGNKKMDLRDSSEIKEFAQDPEMKDYIYYREAELMDDSTVIIDDVMPELEKIASDSNLTGQLQDENKYIFHANGDLEILIGNFLFQKDARANIGIYIDGASGGIIDFYKKDRRKKITLHIDAGGQMEIGNDYLITGYDAYLASQMTRLGYLRLDYIRTKLAK